MVNGFKLNGVVLIVLSPFETVGPNPEASEAGAGYLRI